MYKQLQAFSFGRLERQVWKSELDQNYGVTRNSRWVADGLFKQFDVDRNQVRYVVDRKANFSGGYVVSESDNSVAVRDRAILQILSQV